MSKSIEIRPAEDKDFDEMWKIFQEVIQKGDTYDYEPETSFEDAKRDWLDDPKVKTFVASADGKIAAMYEFRPNRRGLGSHIANASFMVGEAFRGLGLGKLLGKHCLEEAKKDGYLGMQFNFVVSTNTVAVNLWKSLGFEVIGTIPKGYKHSEQGLVDAYIMFRFL